MSEIHPKGPLKAAFERILHQHKVDPVFPEKVLEETRALASKPLDFSGLMDLRELPFVTIDNDDSKDLDQALFVEATDDSFVVWYALADAAYFVHPSSALFERALVQGTSFYLPGLSVPMLPAALSEGLVSLNPKVDRRALVFKVKLDSKGKVQDVKLLRGVVQSRAKLAYDDVQAWLDAKHRRFDDEHFAPSLRNMVKVGVLRIAQAAERDVITFERFEPHVEISADGEGLEVSRRIRNDVERYNEQISLLCNTVGANMMSDFGHSPQLQSVFRVHLPPLSQRLTELKETLDGIVETHGLDERWRWTGQSLADYLAGLPQGSEDARMRMAVERQVRYANRSSDFSATVGPHFALGVDHYARFTAPMREVVGIFTHKEALEVIGYEKPADPSADEILRDRVIEAANRGNATQRSIDRDIGLLVIKQIFDDDLTKPLEDRPIRKGTILGSRSTQLYVVLDDIPIDVKIWTDDLSTLAGHELQHRAGVLGTIPPYVFRIGDEIRIRTSHFDHGRQRVVLAPVFD